MRSRITKLMAAVAALGLTLGLGACEGRIPEPQAAPADVDQIPDLTEEQESKIRASILETLDQATQNMSGDGLSARVTGPMLDVRNSAITVGKATGGLDKTNTIPSDMMQTVIPVDSGWPRTVYTITTTTEDQQSQRLLVFTQDSPRQNYKLWGVARLFAGAQLPRFTVPEIGTQMGLPNDSGLVATPQEAVERYADVLQNGANSEFADQFADDSLRQTIASVAQTVQEGMERNNGTQTQTFTVVPDAIKIMRSSDGGDLVVAQINSEWTRAAGDGRESLPASDEEQALFGDQTFTVVPDAIKIMRSSDGGDLVVAQINSEWTRAAGDGRESLPASDEEQALFGDGTATSTMKVTYVNIVALYVPPEDSGEQITAVGAERKPIKVDVRAAGGFRGTDHGGRCGTQADQGRGDLIPPDVFRSNPASVRGSTISRPLSDVACRCGNRPSRMATRPLCRWGTARFLAARWSKL